MPFARNDIEHNNNDVGNDIKHQHQKPAVRDDIKHQCAVREVGDDVEHNDRAVGTLFLLHLDSSLHISFGQPPHHRYLHTAHLIFVTGTTGVVRFPNPLATGCDIHDSWETWLPACCEEISD